MQALKSLGWPQGPFRHLSKEPSTCLSINRNPRVQGSWREQAILAVTQDLLTGASSLLHLHIHFFLCAFTQSHCIWPPDIMLGSEDIARRRPESNRKYRGQTKCCRMVVPRSFRCRDLNQAWEVPDVVQEAQRMLQKQEDGVVKDMENCRVVIAE